MIIIEKKKLHLYRESTEIFAIKIVQHALGHPVDKYHFYKCDLCNFRSSRKLSLKEHKQSVHPIQWVNGEGKICKLPSPSPKTPKNESNEKKEENKDSLSQENRAKISSADKEESCDLISDFAGGPNNQHLESGCSVPKISKIVFNFKK